MPMRIGFGKSRRMMLEAELERYRAEIPTLGIIRAILLGEMAMGEVGAETGLEILIVQQTEEPFHRRGDFFTNHLLPRLSVEWYVYTPDEFEELSDIDPVLIHAQRVGDELYAA